MDQILDQIMKTLGVMSRTKKKVMKKCIFGEVCHHPSMTWWLVEGNSVSGTGFKAHLFWTDLPPFTRQLPHVDLEPLKITKASKKGQTFHKAQSCSKSENGHAGKFTPALRKQRNRAHTGHFPCPPLRSKNRGKNFLLLLSFLDSNSPAEDRQAAGGAAGTQGRKPALTSSKKTQVPKLSLSQGPCFLGTWATPGFIAWWP